MSKRQHIRETATPDTETFFRVRQFEGKSYGIVGNTIELTLIREGKTLKIEAPIESRNNILLDAYLGRNSGFPSVFVHDGSLLRQQLGSPVVDKTGKVVGINIATQLDRVTYALPASLVQDVIQRLRTHETP